MAGKLDPTAPNEWHALYRAAEKRRREAGWRRRGPDKPRRRLDPGRLLAIAMGLATVTVILCLVIPR
jgi:hypothetical protein